MCRMTAHVEDTNFLRGGFPGALRIQPESEVACLVAPDNENRKARKQATNLHVTSSGWLLSLL